MTLHNIYYYNPILANTQETTQAIKTNQNPMTSFNDRLIHAILTLYIILYISLEKKDYPFVYLQTPFVNKTLL